MKNLVWLISGICAAVAAFTWWNASRMQPVEALAHRLEYAWSDHHTVV